MQQVIQSGDETLTCFLQDLLGFFTTAVLQHRSYLLANDVQLFLALCELILLLSTAPDRESMRVAMGFWKNWSQFIFDTYHDSRPRDPKEHEGPFTTLVQNVVSLLVRRMQRPEEVMLMENEDEEIVRVETQDTDGIALYKTMREALRLLASVDYEITEVILMDRLDFQVFPISGRFL